jgi:hypothetical protein
MYDSPLLCSTHVREDAHIIFNDGRKAQLVFFVGITTI